MKQKSLQIIRKLFLMLFLLATGYPLWLFYRLGLERIGLILNYNCSKEVRIFRSWLQW